MIDSSEQQHTQTPTPSGSPAESNTVVHCIDRLRWPLTFLASIIVISVTGFSIWDRGQDSVESGIEESTELLTHLSDKAESIAARFRQGQITRTFVSSLPDVDGGGSGRLELATLETTEQFRSEDNLKIWWNYLSLGTTVSEINVPVTYRYHLKLDGDWSLSVSNQTCVVMAPRIRPTIPPSIHTGRMEKSTHNGWARFNADDQLEALEKSLTSMLVQYSDDEVRLDLVREEARKTVATFVKNWLLREDHWREDRFHTVVVQFEDETSEPTRIETASRLESPQ